MNTIEIARKLLAVGENTEAVKAYKLALNEYSGQNAVAELECALPILQFGGGSDYKIAFGALVNLVNREFAQADILAVMDEAFYQPNVKTLQKRYEKNCRLLAKYPYIFRQDFPAFADLPLKFYPYDDNQFVPFSLAERRFGDFYEPRWQVISRNFFKDLENPILAAEVFSQYELEYLVDNVRKSEYVARENHIYLHYADWPVFCAYLQCLDLRPLLKEKKIVFLFGEEIEQYPIDFRRRFGIDYSQYPLKPVGIREINRLIWHTQLSAHNGGDFFNEIFDAHPNLLAMPSVMFDSMTETVAEYKAVFAQTNQLSELHQRIKWPDKRLITELYHMRGRTDKDFMVAMYLSEQAETSPFLDKSARIAPAIFFQPHFYNIFYAMEVSAKGRTVLCSEQYEQVRQSPLFRGFKYIKTFTPMRRQTTSHGASVKFKCRNFDKKTQVKLDDVVLNRVLNRSFMIDWQDRLFKDCRLVRFEDGKLNPRATFTALAAFLDLPYTESMTYCSLQGERDPESLEGNDIGFSPAAIYRTYDEYTNDTERAFIEYFMRDAYEYYGYDFQYYDGQPVDGARIEEWLSHFDVIDGLLSRNLRNIIENIEGTDMEVNLGDGAEKIKIDKNDKQSVAELLKQSLANVKNNRRYTTGILMSGLRFVNKNGQPLHLMPRLELDPALLEQPLYH